MYIDLGSLLDNNTSNPDEEEQFDFFPDHVNQRISFKLTNKHAQINSFNAWNKAFRVLIELMEAKWNNLCLPMVQYKHIINEQAGKFPFQQVYAYDKHFHWQLAGDPSIPWNQIDNQLWSRELHGVHQKDLGQNGPSQTSLQISTLLQ